MGNSSKLPLSSTLLICVVLAGGFFLVFLLESLLKELAEQRRIFREDSVWAASQVEREARVFLHTVYLYTDGSQDVVAEDVSQRFDVLWSRISSMDKGRLGDVYLQLDGAGDALALGKKMLVKIEPLLGNIRRGDTNVRDEILAQVEPVIKTFFTVAREASQYSLEHQERRRLNFEKTSKFAILLVAGIFLSGAVLVYLLLRNQKALDQLTHTLEEKVQERTQELEESHYSLNMMSQAIEQSPVSVIMCDPAGLIEYVNPNFENVTGYRFDEAVGKNPRFLKSGFTPEETYREMWNAVHSGNVWKGELCNKRKNGELFWEQVSLSPIKNSQQEISGYLAVKEDITHRKRYEEQLVKQANYDSLTGLPNRLLAMDRLNQMILQAQRHGGAIALLFIDLDNFKQVNDTLGHDCGDLLLKKAAKRFLDCLRDCDTAARFGGDEFLIILSELQDRDDVRPILDRIVEAFARPFCIRGFDFFATASIGVSMCPDDSCFAKDLLKSSDVAMYDAKKAGKNNYCFYSKSPDLGALDN